MAIDFKKTTFEGYVPEIWRGECKMLPGGFKPLQSFATGTVLHRGTPVYVDFSNMTAAVCKTAKVIAGGTTQNPRITKGSLFAVGDVVTKDGNGASTPTVKSIDTSNTAYDVLGLSAAYTGLTGGDVIVESGEKPSDGTASAKYTPNMVVGANKAFDGKGIPTLDVAYEAVVLTASVSSPIPEDWLNGCCLKSNPNILFIKQ